MDSNDDDMQLYFKANDIVTLSWLPEEVVPSYITNDITNIRVDIQLFQQVSNLNWIPIDGAEMLNLNNNGLQEFRIPARLEVRNCMEQNGVCPVAFKVSAARNTEVDITSPGVAAIRVRLPTQVSTVGIWSVVAYLQADNTLLCDKRAEDMQSNVNPTLENLPACPPPLDQENRGEECSSDPNNGKMISDQSRNIGVWCWRWLPFSLVKDLTCVFIH